MKSTAGLKGILGILAIFALAMVVLGYLVSQGVTKFITPPPERVAEGLVDALGAHRYAGALSQLSRDLRQQVSQEELKNLVGEIEQSRQGITQANGIDAHEQGDSASAHVKVKTGNLEEHTIELPLKQENGLWRVSSIEPARSLANP